MNKLPYLEGQIVWHKDQSWMCELATPTKAVFQARTYRVLSPNPASHPGIGGCGGTDRVPCGTFFMMDIGPGRPPIDEKHMPRIIGFAPVNYCGWRSGASFNVDYIARALPELWERMKAAGEYLRPKVDTVSIEVEFDMAPERVVSRVPKEPVRRVRYTKERGDAVAARAKKSAKKVAKKAVAKKK